MENTNIFWCEQDAEWSPHCQCKSQCTECKLMENNYDLRSERDELMEIFDKYDQDYDLESGEHIQAIAFHDLAPLVSEILNNYKKAPNT